MTASGNGVYKVICAFLVGGFSTGLFQYLVTGREVVTHAQMVEYDRISSEYAKARALIDERLKEDETYWKEEHLYQIELDKRLRELESEVSETRAHLKLPHRTIARISSEGGK
jgi:hypothetical protein